MTNAKNILKRLESLNDNDDKDITFYATYIPKSYITEIQFTFYFSEK